MKPNPKYLVPANTIDMLKGTYVEGIHESGDFFTMARDKEGLEALALDTYWDSVEEMARDFEKKIEDLLNVPFMLYGADLRIIFYEPTALVAVLNEDTQSDENGELVEDFWQQEEE